MMSPASRTWLLAGTAILASGTMWRAARASPTYTQDTDLSHFTATVSTYATFTAGLLSPSGSVPYTPTGTILLSANYPRMIGSSSSAIIAQFGVATAQILVFNNIDHIGYGWDAYQYAIYGSNDGSSYTLLFNPQSVNEPDNNSAIATPFTIAAYTGTAPVFINNTVTPGAGSSVGLIGYEAYFDFGASVYSYYKLLPSTLTLTAPNGENEIEFSAIAQAAAPPVEPVPEPTAIGLFTTALAGLAGLRLAGWQRRKVPQPTR